jgi:hypothetical protein
VIQGLQGFMDSLISASPQTEGTKASTSVASDSAEGSPLVIPSGGGTVTDEHNPDVADPNDKLAAEFLALRQAAKKIAIIGSRNIPLPHQTLTEALAFTLVRDGNTIITSGGSSGVNAAVIRGAMRANPKLLNVILPQTIGHQPSDVQDELIGIPNIKEHPNWATMTLADASRLCNRVIVEECDQLIIFLFHDSHTLHMAIDYAEEQGKIVTRFYLD